MRSYFGWKQSPWRRDFSGRLFNFPSRFLDRATLIKGCLFVPWGKSVTSPRKGDVGFLIKCCARWQGWITILDSVLWKPRIFPSANCAHTTDSLQTARNITVENFVLRLFTIYRGLSKSGLSNWGFVRDFARFYRSFIFTERTWKSNRQTFFPNVSLLETTTNLIRFLAAAISCLLLVFFCFDAVLIGARYCHLILKKKQVRESVEIQTCFECSLRISFQTNSPISEVPAASGTFSLF